MFPLSKLTNPQHSSQFKLIKNPDSIGVSDRLIHKTKPVTLFNNLLTFRDTGKKFQLHRDLLKIRINKNYKVDLANLLDEKVLCDFAKEFYFEEKALGNISTGYKALVRLLKSPAIMAVSFKESKTRFISSSPNERCDRLKLLLKEKQAGNTSDIIKEEIFAIADALLGYKGISTEQHKLLTIQMFKLNE